MDIQEVLEELESQYIVSIPSESFNFETYEEDGREIVEASAHIDGKKYGGSLDIENLDSEFERKASLKILYERVIEGVWEEYIDFGEVNDER